MRSFFGVVLVWCAFSTASLPHLAFAQPAPTKEAQARFSEGLTLHDAGRDEEARLKFQQAYALLKNPNVLFNLARSEQLSGHPLEAAAHWRDYIADPAIPEKDREAAKKQLAEVAKILGHVAIEAPAGTKLALDGKPVDGVPKEPLDVLPGRHSVEATIDGKARVVDVSPDAGETQTARFTAESAPPVVAPPVVAPPAPAATVAPPVAETAPPAESTAVLPPPESGGGTNTARNTTAIVVGGAALIAVGVGVGFSLAASNQSGKADTAKEEALRGNPGADPRSVCAGSTNPSCANWHNAAESNVSNKNLATGFFVTGGVLAVAAVTVLVAWPGATKTTGRLRFVPAVGPRDVGGHFAFQF